MADGIYYKDGIVITTLVAGEKVLNYGEGTPYPTEHDVPVSCVLNLPFPTFGQNIVCEGSDITEELFDDRHLGKEVMAKIDVRTEDFPLLQAHNGYLGDDPTTHPRYADHYNVPREPGHEELELFTPMSEPIDSPEP